MPIDDPATGAWPPRGGADASEPHDGRAIPQPRSVAGIASAEDGVVILDGPEGLAITLTAQAAAETGQSLIDAAAKAQRQPRAVPAAHGQDEHGSGWRGESKPG